MTLDNSPKTLLGISMVILVFASGFSILNAIRVKTLHANFASRPAGGEAPERRQLMQEQAPTTAKANALSNGCPRRQIPKARPPKPKRISRRF